MQYKQTFILFCTVISGLFIIGCTKENPLPAAALGTYTAGLWTPGGVAIIAATPLIVHDPYKDKTKKQVINMVGKPVARYECIAYEIWEYPEDQLSRNERFLTFSSNISQGQRKYIPFLNECALLEGAPTKKTMNDWIVKTLVCGKNFYKQVSKGSKEGEFFIDMKTNHGKFTITQWRRYRILNAEYVIFYDGKEIYRSPKANFDSSKPPAEKIIETVKFGPGKSTSIMIRVLRKFDYMYDLKISCPK